MNYYWFNRQEILQKAKEKYSNKKAAEYYKQNKEAIIEKSTERYRNFSQELVTSSCFFLIIKMSEKTLQFNNIILNKKKFISLKNQLTYCQ